MYRSLNWCHLRWLRAAGQVTDLTSGVSVLSTASCLSAPITSDWPPAAASQFTYGKQHRKDGPDPQFAPVPLLEMKPTSRKVNKPQPFVDWRRLRVRAGRGGDGCMSLARVYRNPRAGPDGGDGGAGGHIIFKASSNVKSLGGLRSIIIGNDGEKGSKRECHGKTAEHTIIEVPIGTLFRSQCGTISASLDTEGAMFVAARGGAGGRGNKYFATDTNQTPRIAEEGADGESFVYQTELRTMADVGLIGFPNAGKSTLLRAISRARPKVAAYPFTTLQPHVGMVLYSDHTQLAVADIPGLIRDAHKNRGLGVSFLRHVQRCTCLLYVLDLSADPVDQLAVLRRELDMYAPRLSHRPHAIVANKVDLPAAQENVEVLRAAVDIPVLPLSAKMGTNVLELMHFIRELYENNRESAETGPVSHELDRLDR